MFYLLSLIPFTAVSNKLSTKTARSLAQSMHFINCSSLNGVPPGLFTRQSSLFFITTVKTPLHSDSSSSVGSIRSLLQKQKNNETIDYYYAGCRWFTETHFSSTVNTKKEQGVKCLDCVFDTVMDL